MLLSAPFDPSAERARIAQTLLRSAGRLIMGRREREIVAGICEELTRITPHIRLAWTWFGPSDAELIAPQVYAGPAADYARRLVIQRNLLTERGPAYRALKGQPVEPFQVSPRSLYGPWRQAAVEHGVRNALALTLPSGLAGTGGLFVLYADTPGYFESVGVSLFESLADLFGSVLTLAAERHALERTAYHDALTGLLNRHALPLVERRVHRETGFAPPVAVLLADLDHFKRLNDSRGHAGGDAVLRATAGVLRAGLRRGDEALRWGGEEFLLCLPGSTLADAAQVAEKLRLAVAALDAEGTITCSIGVAELAPQESLTDAVTRADAALYLAKAGGRNRIQTTG